MPKAKPYKDRPLTRKQLADRYMKDLEMFRPDEDGRTLRGLATRLANIDDRWEMELLLAEELGIEPRYDLAPKPESGVANGGSSRGSNLQRNSISAQGKGKGRRG